MSTILASDAVTSWEHTILCRTLAESQKADAQAVMDVLRIWMPKIQAILAIGGTSPTDFTLHDAGHALRVAQRMAEIMPPETLKGLSPFEVAFLLLTAYLHDIGMTPEQRKVTLYYHLNLAIMVLCHRK